MLAASVAGVFTSGYFFAFHVLHIIVRNNLLGRVLQSVTKNGRALLWVAALAAVVIYVFTIFEFAFYRGSFYPATPLLCDTLWECYITTLDFGPWTLSARLRCGRELTSVRPPPPEACVVA